MENRIVFMGTPKFAADILEGLIVAGFNIVGVVSQPDKEFGRKRVLKSSEVKEVALKHNLPVLTPTRIKTEYQDILDLNPDLIITSAYGQIVPKVVLDYPKYKCINTHGSLLPKYRGGSPIQTAIINGDKTTGMTLMYMNERMDEGDIIAQESIDIDMRDTNTTLFDKLSKLALNMLLEYVPKMFNGEVVGVPQDHSLGTYTSKLDKQIEHISFNDDVYSVYNHIRGLLDNPGCYFVIKNKKYKIIDAYFEYGEAYKPNSFIGLENDYLRIDCNNGFIKIFKLKPEGKNEMDSKSFYNGAGRSLVGEVIG